MTSHREHGAGEGKGSTDQLSPLLRPRSCVLYFAFSPSLADLGGHDGSWDRAAQPPWADTL